MGKYRVLRAFRAVFGEREYSGLPGQVIELSEEVAAWLERDAPGRIEVLRGGVPPTQDDNRAMEAPARDRMQRKQRNR